MKYICTAIEERVAINCHPYTHLTYQGEGNPLDICHINDFTQNKHKIGEIMHARIVEYKLQQPMRYLYDRHATKRSSIILTCPVVFDEQLGKYVDSEDVETIAKRTLKYMKPAL